MRRDGVVGNSERAGDAWVIRPRMTRGASAPESTSN